MNRVTKTASLVVGLGLALGLVSVCFAGKGKTNDGSFAPKKVKAPQEAHESVVSQQATITKVDGANITFTLQIPATASTKVTVDGQTKTIADLKPGQAATVTFSGSELTAIVANGSAAAPAAAAPAATPAAPAAAPAKPAP